MNQQEAKIALSEGATLTHHSFTSDEFVKGITNNLYEFEGGGLCTAQQFWQYRQDEGFNDGREVYDAQENNSKMKTCFDEIVYNIKEYMIPQSDYNWLWFDDLTFNNTIQPTNPYFGKESWRKK